MLLIEMLLTRTFFFYFYKIDIFYRFFRFIFLKGGGRVLGELVGWKGGWIFLELENIEWESEREFDIFW